MKEYKAVVVSVPGYGWYSYSEVRLVHKNIDGGHYANSRGCTIIRRSGPRRGVQRLLREYTAEAERMNKSAYELVKA